MTQLTDYGTSKKPVAKKLAFLAVVLEPLFFPFRWLRDSVYNLYVNTYHECMADYYREILVGKVVRFEPCGCGGKGGGVGTPRNIYHGAPYEQHCIHTQLPPNSKYILISRVDYYRDRDLDLYPEGVPRKKKPDYYRTYRDAQRMEEYLGFEGVQLIEAKDGYISSWFDGGAPISQLGFDVPEGEQEMLRMKYIP